MSRQLLVFALFLCGLSAAFALAFQGKLATGGPITRGAWAPSYNFFCTPSLGLVFFNPHRMVATNGKEAKVSYWLDVAGTDADPTLKLSMAADQATPGGWLLSAHVDGDSLAFVRLTNAVGWSPTGGDLSGMDPMLQRLRANQPWHRCMGLQEPEPPKSR